MSHLKAPIKALKRGEYVRFTATGPVWIRGDYCAASKTYELQSADDLNKCTYRKGSFEVFHGFTY